MHRKQMLDGAADNHVGTARDCKGEIFIVLWIKALPDQLIRVNPLCSNKHDVSYSGSPFHRDEALDF
jgi:hypothetical protein